MAVRKKTKLALVAIALLALLAGLVYRMRKDEPDVRNRSTAGREPDLTSADGAGGRPSGAAVAAIRVTGRCASVMDDAPVAAADVHVGRLHVRTDADGRFRVALDEARTALGVVIEADGFERRSLSVAANTAVDLGTVYLRPARVLTGSVRSVSGEPVAGAGVRITAKGHLLARLETDSDGMFRYAATRAALNRLAQARRLTVSAYKPGYEAAVAYAAGFDDAVRLVLDKGQDVSGTVRDARTGQPLEGASICNRPRSNGTSTTGFVVATTDAGGRFRASSCALRETQWQLLASKPGYAPQAVAVFDPSTSVDFVLTPATTLRGSVVRNGRPVEDVEVVAVVANGEPPRPESKLVWKVRGRSRVLEEHSMSGVWRSALMPGTRTRPDGTFEIAGVPADTPLRVTARRDSVSASVSVASAPVEPLVLELVPDSGQVIVTVAAVDPGGRPVRDAVVCYAYATPRKRLASEAFVGTTGKQGTVEIVGRIDWAYGFWITARTGSRSGVVGPIRYPDVADRVVRVTVAEGTRVCGRLGLPTGSARVHVELWRALAEEAYLGWDRVFVRGAGGFGLPGTPAGEYVLVITGSRIAPYTVPISLRDEPPTLDLGTIPLRPGRRLSGTVVRDGAPVRKVLVQVRYTTNGPLLPESEQPRMVTGEDGRFAFEGLSHAPVKLVAMPLLEKPVPVERECAADVTSVEIDLGPR